MSTAAGDAALFGAHGAPAILVLKVQDPPGSRPRTISSFTISPAPDATARPSLAAALEPHNPSDAVRILLVSGFQRGSPLPAPTSATGSLQIVASDPTRIPEWNRFASYLLHGVEGTSQPKAAVCAPSGGSQFLILPPSCVPPADHRFAVPLTVFPWVSASSARPQYPAAPATALALPPAHPIVFRPPKFDALGSVPLPRGEDVYRDHGKVYLSQGDVNASLVAGRLQALKDTWVQKIVKGEVPFPFKKHCIPSEQVLEWFALLRKYHETVGLKHTSFAPLHGYYPKGGSFEATVTWPITASAPPLSIRLGAPARATIGPEQATLMTGLPPAPEVMAWLAFDNDFNEIGSALVDYFSEPARMLAVRKDEGAPPLELWQTEEVARFVVEKALRKYGALTDFSLRHGLYGKVAGCNLFKCHLASSIYTFLGGTRVLDPCAGWGDRLLGAMGTPAVKRYLAFDPNPALVPCHQGMISTLKAHATAGADYQVVSAGFEAGDIPCTYDADGRVVPAFDLVMTSPPYFDLELYEDERRKGLQPTSVNTAASTGASSAGATATSGQSTVTFPTLEGWLEHWYFPMMLKAWSHLLPGGHMAFYINDHAASNKPKKFKSASASAANRSAASGSAGAGAGAGQKRSFKEASDGWKDASAGQAAAEEEEDLDAEILMCLPMLRYAGKHLPGCIWVGCVGIEGEKTGAIRPLWVWRKDHGNPSALPTNAEGQVAPLYSSLAAHLAKSA